MQRASTSFSRLPILLRASRNYGSTTPSRFLSQSFRNFHQTVERKATLHQQPNSMLATHHKHAIPGVHIGKTVIPYEVFPLITVVTVACSYGLIASAKHIKSDHELRISRAKFNNKHDTVVPS